MKKIITAKFNSVCAETGRPIKKGDHIVYDYTTKRCYASGSPTQQAFIKPDPASGMLDEAIEQEYERWYAKTYGNRLDNY